MSGPFSLIVTDTSPLFTLVLADALDTLLRPGAGLLQSADQVLDQAAEHGRNVDRQRRSRSEEATRMRFSEQAARR